MSRANNKSQPESQNGFRLTDYMQNRLLFSLVVEKVKFAVTFTRRGGGIETYHCPGEPSGCLGAEIAGVQATGLGKRFAAVGGIGQDILLGGAGDTQVNVSARRERECLGVSQLVETVTHNELTFPVFQRIDKDVIMRGVAGVD